MLSEHLVVIPRACFQLSVRVNQSVGKNLDFGPIQLAGRVKSNGMNMSVLDLFPIGISIRERPPITQLVGFCMARVALLFVMLVESLVPKTN